MGLQPLHLRQRLGQGCSPCRTADARADEDAPCDVPRTAIELHGLNAERRHDLVVRVLARQLYAESGGGGPCSVSESELRLNVVAERINTAGQHRDRDECARHCLGLGR